MKTIAQQASEQLKGPRRYAKPKPSQYFVISDRPGQSEKVRNAGKEQPESVQKRRALESALEEKRINEEIYGY